MDDGRDRCLHGGLDQAYPQIVSDGSGGAIVTWRDYRSGSTYDIYAQRVNASGVQWTANGVALSLLYYGNQQIPQIATDGSGGAIVTWQDYRSSTIIYIYSQRVNGSGVVLWMEYGEDGVPVCTTPSEQMYPDITSNGSEGAIIAWFDNRGWYGGAIYAQSVDSIGAAQWAVDGVAISSAAAAMYDAPKIKIVSDGSGGAIITWLDNRGGSTYDIYTQRVDASGIPQWTTNGVAICAAPYEKLDPQITADGSGGAIITWQDYRSGSTYGIYAQRVDASGIPQWTTNGVAVCTAAYNQYYPQIISDGLGGAIITWQDPRAGSYDIYAQRVDASGIPQWTANGVVICAAAYVQIVPQITADDSGGAIITWRDYRSGSYPDIYAQRVDASGIPQWTANGVAICAATNSQLEAQITADGSGGAIITWQDRRGGSTYDIYAQRVTWSGVVQWMTDGIAVCMAGYDQTYPRIVSDGSGGAIATWQDTRSGSSYDIYAQRVNANGAALWEDEGVPISATSDYQEVPRLTSNGAGEAIITWMDSRGGYRVYAQRATEYGLGPICNVEPRVIDLPEAVLVGSSRDTSFVITNEGVEPFIGGASVVSDQFWIVSGGGSFLLSNGQSHVVTVRYEPTAPGTHSCTIETGAYICSDVTMTGTSEQLPPDSVIYVDADATGVGGGSSWPNAFTELQDALALAPSCPDVTQIWVAEGTYRPTTGTDRTATFQLLNNLALYGGFAGTEIARAERNVHAHVTTLSGDIGMPGDASDNSYHVATGSLTDTTAVLDGFTVTGGKADGGDWEQMVGGGLYNFRGSPTLANIEFRANAVQGAGGGIYNEDGNPRMINAIFRQNSAAGKGGGMCSYNVYGCPILTNVLLIGNASGEAGGGIYSEGSMSLVLVNASFFGNSALGPGGAMCNFSGSPVITNTIMWGDSSAWCSEASQNCSEIFNYPGVSPTISYSLIQGSGGSAGWDALLGTDGGGNIDADPLYYGAEAGDLRLLVGSPAIDAGSIVSGLPATDIVGNPRIQGVTVDMGAYEGGTAALFSYARMDSLVDVPDDQGGWLRIHFTRSSYDNALEEEYPIERYDIHRRVDDVVLLASIAGAGEVIAEDLTVKLSGGEKISLVPPPSDADSKYVSYADRIYLVNEADAEATAPAGTWEVIGNVSAAQQEQYIRLAPTLADSAATIPWSVYYISAHTTTPSVYFDSPPDSGYSVDNIAPGVPEGLMVAYNTGSGNQLSWDPSVDSDFQYFKIYRGTDTDFVPTAENMVDATTETEWSDPEYDGWSVYYKIAALDHVGNESAPASPESTTGKDNQPISDAFSLYQNMPNPFNPSTSIRYDVPAGVGAVSLRIYDVSGRLVRTLVDGPQAMGQKTAVWNGEDDRGRSVVSGVYFYRLEAPGYKKTLKMILIQ